MRRPPLRRTCTRLAVVALAAVSLLAAAPSAHAYKLGGRPWPGGVVRFYQQVPASYTWQIDAAARAWNTSGANVRFVRTRSRANAGLVIRYGSTAGAASATLGYWRPAYLTVRRPRSRVSVTEGRSAGAQLFAHEFGHVLGLQHPSTAGCQLMDEYLSPCLETARQPWLWHCRILMPDDLRGAIRRYGRRARPRGTPNFCLREPAAPAVASLAASGGAASTPVTLEWSTARALAAGSRFELVVHDGTCATASDANDIAGYELGRATRSWTDSGVLERAPGAYCYRIRSSNAYRLATRWLARDVTTSASPPAAPNVVSLTLVTDPADFADYQATVELPASTTLQVMHGPPGDCPTSPDDPDATQVRVDGQGTSWWLIGVPEGQGCLSFFAVRSASFVASAPTTRIVDHPPDA